VSIPTPTVGAPAPNPSSSFAEQAAYDHIAAAADAAGADVFAHALDTDSGAEIGIASDDPVVTASVFKVPVLTEYVRQVEAGELDPSSRVHIPAGSGTVGSTGLSVFSDDADWSLRDVATSMITVSDNAATDIVTAMVGIERVNATMAALGLPGTALTRDCRGLFATMAQDLGTDDPAEVDELLAAEPSRWETLTACTPLRTNRSTPRESTRLLQLLWTDAAAGPAACAEARRIMGLQIWPHRLSSGFPRDDVKISGKTGRSASCAMRSAWWNSPAVRGWRSRCSPEATGRTTGSRRWTR
jgi:beta-lactamase class A